MFKIVILAFAFGNVGYQTMPGDYPSYQQCMAQGQIELNRVPRGNNVLTVVCVQKQHAPR